MAPRAKTAASLSFQDLASEVDSLAWCKKGKIKEHKNKARRCEEMNQLIVEFLQYKYPYSKAYSNFE